MFVIIKKRKIFVFLGLNLNHSYFEVNKHCFRTNDIPECVVKLTKFYKTQVEEKEEMIKLEVLLGGVVTCRKTIRIFGKVATYKNTI